MSNEFVTRAAAQGIELPDPTGAPDGQVVTTASGAYGLATPSGGVDTSLQAAPDTGWTQTGTGAAVIASGTATLTLTSAQTSARLYRTAPSSPWLPATEVLARVTRTTTPGSGAHWQGINVSNDAGDRGYLIQVASDGTVGTFWSNAGSWIFSASAAAAATWDSGTLWLRIVVTPHWCSLFQGVGVGDAAPTSWSRISVFDAASPSMADVVGAGLLTAVSLYTGRAGGGSGDFVATTRAFSVRSLLGAPT